MSTTYVVKCIGPAVGPAEEIQHLVNKSIREQAAEHGRASLVSVFDLAGNVMVVTEVSAAADSPLLDAAGPPRAEVDMPAPEQLSFEEYKDGYSPGGVWQQRDKERDAFVNGFRMCLDIIGKRK